MGFNSWIHAYLTYITVSINYSLRENTLPEYTGPAKEGEL